MSTGGLFQSLVLILMKGFFLDKFSSFRAVNQRYSRPPGFTGGY
jgi:hypothetical protein